MPRAQHYCRLVNRLCDACNRMPSLKAMLMGIRWSAVMARKGY